MIGIGGVVPVRICSWTPYLAQFQYHPNPMSFAIKTFLLMQVVVYAATLGAGGCMCMKNKSTAFYRYIYSCTFSL